MYGVLGEICANAPYLADSFRGSGLSVSFINATNAAEYLGDSTMSATEKMKVLGQALGQLPLSRNLLIVDSSSESLVPVVYTRSEYPGINQPIAIGH